MRFYSFNINMSLKWKRPFPIHATQMEARVFEKLTKNQLLGFPIYIFIIYIYTYIYDKFLYILPVNLNFKYSLGFVFCFVIKSAAITSYVSIMSFELH